MAVRDSLPPSRLSDDGRAAPIGRLPGVPPGVMLGGEIFYDEPMTPEERRWRWIGALGAAAVFVFAMVVLVLVMQEISGVSLWGLIKGLRPTLLTNNPVPPGGGTG